ncbi:putative disease resistance protein [Citrus sinensis]|nr:putative disease resistance protein [Citrus sinensis]
MDCVSPILDIFTRLWDCSAAKSSYIRHLEDNLKSLSEKKSQIEDLNEDIKRRVETEEQQQQRKRKKVVEGWLNAVESEIKEVDGILQKGCQEIEKKCLGGCCTRNCYASYKIGKTVTEEISKVTLLRLEGQDFESVYFTYKLPRPPVDGMATEKTVGADSKLDEVWGCIEDQSEQTIGLYGMGGVGKITLLKKPNNKFLDVNHCFDLVIFVAVSKEGNLEKIQEVIRKKLDISDYIWNMKGEYDRAVEILISLRRKKFVLLLDDVWERLDLSKTGVSLSDCQNGSKIVFTTRSEEVGEDVFNSHPEIPTLVQAVVGECKGLPLALIAIARAMSSRRSPREWQYAIDELRTNPSRFAEEINIRKGELIDLWIGEGFLSDFRSITTAWNQGEYIIGSLKIACLLKTGEYSENFVKMHDIVRDMALWLASNESKILVQRSSDCTNKSADSWREAFRLSLWGSSIESLPETPSCPHLQTLLVRFTVLETFPHRFFESMGALKVLDLSYNLDLTQLPAGIGALINLRYLNLSNTSVEELPSEIIRIKRLTIMHNLDSHSIDLRNMRHLETLNIVECSLERVDPTFNGWTNFHNLHHLSIRACPVIRDLTWIREAPNLQFLSLVNCQALSEIIESAGSSEVAESHNYFAYLMVIDLDSLPSLKRICHGTMPFPSLQNVSVTNCPNLRELPFNFDSAKNSLVSIRGSAEWWEQLQWEDEATKHVFAAKFREL